MQDTLDDLFDQLDEAQKQLQSDDYSRMVVYLNLPEETDETFAFVNKMHDIIGKYYRFVLRCRQYDERHGPVQLLRRG